MTEPAAPPRYAVYYALPRNSRLWQLAQAWLGRDCESGQRLTQPSLEGWSPEQIAAATESPRRYGFHATLKAPFDLAEGVTLNDLRQELSGFVQHRQPFRAPPLEVSAIGPFLALTLSEPCPEMEALAADAVIELDRLRAPLGDADLERRLESGLTPRQEELLRSWGYPYVLEEFRFHMTLTGPLADAAQREDLKRRLAAHLETVLKDPVPVGEICLYSQETRDQPFLLRERFALGEKAAAREGRTSAGPKIGSG